MFSRPGTITTPKDLFYDALYECSPAEFTVLCAVIRETVGKDELWSRISISNMEAMTGLSRSTIRRNLDELKNQGWISRWDRCPMCGMISEEKATEYLCQNCGYDGGPQSIYAPKLKDGWTTSLPTPY